MTEDEKKAESLSGLNLYSIGGTYSFSGGPKGDKEVLFAFGGYFKARREAAMTRLTGEIVDTYGPSVIDGVWTEDDNRISFNKRYRGHIREPLDETIKKDLGIRYCIRKVGEEFCGHYRHNTGLRDPTIIIVPEHFAPDFWSEENMKKLSVGHEVKCRITHVAADAFNVISMPPGKQ
ncbi:MAG: hypothetical protein PHU12_01340 [Candidatus Aenigmarchaeota archaeon]|nr:hypothetical protein [Candidatus Aenigmarchaeota archaeon]